MFKMPTQEAFLLSLKPRLICDRFRQNEHNSRLNPIVKLSRLSKDMCDKMTQKSVFFTDLGLSVGACRFDERLLCPLTFISASPSFLLASHTASTVFLLPLSRVSLSSVRSFVSLFINSSFRYFSFASAFDSPSDISPHLPDQSSSQSMHPRIVNTELVRTG